MFSLNPPLRIMRTCLVHKSLSSAAYKRFSTSPPKITQLEVERKFNITQPLDTELKKQEQMTKISKQGPGLDPHAAMLTFSDKRYNHIKDEYFDFEGALAAKGIWIRKRTIDTLPVEWEAKVRVSGDFQNSGFEEVYGEGQVMGLVERVIPLWKLVSKVELLTERESWVVKDHFLEALVMLDYCCAPNSPPVKREGKEVEWIHAVGEVEMIRNIELTGDAGVDQVKKADMSAWMDYELKEFMLRHEKLFPTTPAPVGKLTAFFKWKAAHSGR